MPDEDERIVDRRAAARMKDDAEDGSSPEQRAETGAADGGDESVEALKERADRMYANWQRSAADFINYKRRVEEERAETARFANAALVINMLPVYDDLERAIATVDANLAGLNWVQGVDAIHRKFGRLLEAMGVTALEAKGAKFDPAEHEAVGRQAGEEGKILHVVQQGYKLGDRVIRPAMVIVGNGE